MRRHQTLYASLMASIAIGVGYPGDLSAQEHRGTMEQQMACTPDVFRLCGSQIPDEDRIVACLKRNVPLLSGRCRAVFAADDPSAPQGRDPSQRRFDQRRFDNPPRERGDDDFAPRRDDDEQQ